MNLDVDPDYELRAASRTGVVDGGTPGRRQHRRTGKPHARRIPIDRAREAYDRLGNWRLVAEELQRADGTKYQPNSIKKAVLHADKGFAGRLGGGG